MGQQFGPMQLTIIIGVGLLISGISDTIATLYMTRKVKEFVKVRRAMEQEVEEIEVKEIVEDNQK